MKKESLILYVLLVFAVLACRLEKKKSEELKLIKKIFDLSDPVQKSEFDSWVKLNLTALSNEASANKYESASKFSFTGAKQDSIACDFEDDNFEVYSSCAGEFGGSLFFIDKKNRDKIYVLSSVCPKMIDFKDGQYIVTSTLAHMSGSASVKILADPRRLPLFQKDKYLNKQTPTPEGLLETVIDTFGITANIYYPYKNRGFIVFSTYDTAYLGEIINGKIINKEPILNHGIWTYGRKMNKIKNGIYISQLSHSSTSIDKEQNLEITVSVEGAIYIKQDTLVLGYKYAKTAEKRN